MCIIAVCLSNYKDFCSAPIDRWYTVQIKVVILVFRLYLVIDLVETKKIIDRVTVLHLFLKYYISCSFLNIHQGGNVISSIAGLRQEELMIYDTLKNVVVPLRTF